MYSSYSYKRKNTDEFMRNIETHESEQRSTMVRNQSKGTQTDYRESETQTMPWEPPYRLSTNVNSELLDLTFLRWNDGLPLGMNEVNMIRRMKMRKLWESVLPPLDSKVNIQTHNAIIAMIDKNEWASRDKELQSKVDSGLALMDEIIKQNNIEQKKKLTERLEKIGKHLNQIRTKELFQIKREFNRQLRKLKLKYHGVNSKIILDTIYNRNNKSILVKKDYHVRHKLPDKSLNTFNQFYDTVMKEKCFDDYKQMDPVDIPKISHVVLKNRNKPEELCIRETRWSDEELKNLHEDLKKIRLNGTTQEKKFSLHQNKVHPHFSASF